jgi:transposase-like protein
MVNARALEIVSVAVRWDGLDLWTHCGSVNGSKRLGSCLALQISHRNYLCENCNCNFILQMKMSASTDLATCSLTAPTLWAAFTARAFLATLVTASAVKVSGNI